MRSSATTGRTIAVGVCAVGVCVATLADAVQPEAARPVYPSAQAKLVKCGEVPCVSVNGEILPPMSFTAFMPHRVPDAYLRDIGKAGLRIHYLYAWTRGLKPGDVEKDELDGVEETVKRIRRIKALCPDAYFVIRLMVSPSADWLAANPDECVRFTDGSFAHGICTTVDRRRAVNMHSMCSEKWWAWADAQIEDFYRELSRHPEMQSVIGTFLCAGGTCEWYYPGLFRKPETKATGDCSAPFRRQYGRFLRERYGTLEELRRVWKRPDATFENPLVPSFGDFDYIGDEHEKIVAALNGGAPYERGANPAAFGDFLDMNRAPWAADFFAALHDGTARAIVHFAETLKRVQPTLLVGAFYGSYAQTTLHDGGTASGVLRILDSPAIDFLAAPGGYNNREPGGLVIGRTMQDAFLLRGKVFISEDDDRTFLTRRSNALSPADDPVTGSGPEGTLNMLKRDFGRNLCEHTRGWWFDMQASWFPGTKSFYDDPRILALFAEQQRIARAAYAAGMRKANDIALVYSSDAIHCASAIVGQNALDFWRLCDLNRLGAPVDYHFLDDLANPAMRDYRLYVMVNAYALAEAQRAAVYAKARRNGATVLWLYAPGFIDRTAARTMDVANIARTVGLNVRLYDGTRTPFFRAVGSDRVYGAFDGEIHTCEFGRKTVARVENYLNPAFYVDDPQAQTLGTSADDGRVVFASVVRDGVRSVYSANVFLHRDLVARLAAEAGCHLFVRPGDVLYADESFVTLHATGDGLRTIRFKRPCSPYEVYEKRFYGSGVESIDVDLKNGETRMWRLEEAGGPAGE